MRKQERWTSLAIIDLRNILEYGDLTMYSLAVALPPSRCYDDFDTRSMAHLVVVCGAAKGVEH